MGPSIRVASDVGRVQNRQRSLLADRAPAFVGVLFGVEH